MYPLLVFRGNNSALTSRAEPRHSPRSTANISIARSTAKFADNTWSFLLTSNMCALSGTPRRRRLHLHLMYGRMQLTPSGSVSLASAYRFKTHSIHLPCRITRRLEDL